jgi:hypothetical protein
MTARNDKQGLELLAYRELSPKERACVAIDHASGEPLADVRRWTLFTQVTGLFFPTKRGLSMTFDDLDWLIGRLQEARAQLGSASDRS